MITQADTSIPASPRSSRRPLVLAAAALGVASLLSLFVGVVNVSPMSVFEPDTDAYRAW